MVLCVLCAPIPAFGVTTANKMEVSLISMPALNLLLRNWNREQRIFFQNLTELKKQINPVAIHDLRVSVKKIRAYLKLHCIICKDPSWKNDFIETETLFGILGKYRDIEMAIKKVEQLEQKNLSEYPLFKVYLHSNLKLSTFRIKPSIQEYGEEELKTLSLKIKPQLIGLADDAIVTHVKDLIQNHFKKINHYIKKIFSEAHNIRKLMKDVYYWTQLYPRDTFFDNALNKKLDKILNSLGDWQDIEVLQSHVKHFRQDFVANKTDEYNDLKKFEKSIKENNQISLGKISERIAEFINDFHQLRSIKKEIESKRII